MKYTVKATFGGEEITQETTDYEEAQIMAEQAFEVDEDDIEVTNISVTDENGDCALSDEMKEYMGV